MNECIEKFAEIFLNPGNYNIGTYYLMQKYYYELFGKVCNRYDLWYSKLTKKPTYEKNSGTDISHIKKETSKQLIGINVREFLENITKKFEVVAIPYILGGNGTHIVYVGDNFIIVNCSSLTSNEVDLEDIDVFTTDDRIQSIIDCYPDYVEDSGVTYRYVTVDNSGDFDYNTFELTQNANVDLENYNEDIPYNEFVKFCESDKCGLSLMLGKPGTGKTTFIKKLISNSNAIFYLLDASLLGSIVTSSFIDFVMQYCRNSVFILEDCEKLLLDRNVNNNPWIGTLLNLTDGMLGEGLNVKFICTFNAPLNTIDSALLRPGRLKISYEFKPLTADRVAKLAEKLHKDITGTKTLAEIYADEIVKNDNLNKSVKLGF